MLKLLQKAVQPLNVLSEGHVANMGYKRMGLFLDDLIPDETPIVQEALSRLEQSEEMQRAFRFRRALNLSMLQEELSESDWTSEDTPYLRPLISQVEAEIETKQIFDNLSEIPPLLRNRNKST